MGKYINYKNENGISKDFKLLKGTETNKDSLKSLIVALSVIFGFVGLCNMIASKNQISTVPDKKVQKMDSVQNNLKNMYILKNNQKAR